jgi:hypothetical protein
VDRQETAYTAWETLSVMGSIGETNNDKAIPGVCATASPGSGSATMLDPAARRTAAIVPPIGSREKHSLTLAQCQSLFVVSRRSRPMLARPRRTQSRSLKLWASGVPH